MHHPWHRFRLFADWTLEWSELPGDLMGHTDFAARTVTVDSRLDQAARRCTIDHEVEHVVRGPVGERYWPREERMIDQIVARRLIPLGRLAEAMVWAYHEEELAAELWVDVDTLRTRLHGLTDAETRVLNERLDASELTFPSECC
jgi:hypothetical protein